MIVVVEGPSGAGKTTWVNRHHAACAVCEYQATGSEPSSSDGPQAAAQFWAEVNARRWQAAVELEARAGLAVCDTDPLKLHYVWTLWRIGEVSHARWIAEANQVRERFEKGGLGLADLFLVELPDEAQLRHRKESDTTRRRRNFELHARIAEPLREWYSAVAALDPDRVRWSHPAEPLQDDAFPARHPRTGTDVLDALLEALPAR